MNSELLYLLAFTYAPDLGPVNQRKILKEIPVREIWELSNKEAGNIFKDKKEWLAYFKSSHGLELAQKEIEFCKANQIEILTLEDENYPESLKHTADAPLVLFKRGNYNFNKKLHIGMVGTRQMTAYGKKFIKNFIEDVAGQNIAVISGLALGCDIEAHRNSNNNNIPNIAVLAHGLNQIAPRRHVKDAEEILKNGAWVSEYSSFHNPEPMNFVIRNRIIAGLSDAVIVVESDLKGGALFTAEYANSYNREVFAVPGRVEDKFSLGCNQLIQSNKAVMIRRAKDLLDYFNLRINPKPIQKELFIALEPEERLIYDFLKTNGRQQIDVLGAELNIPVFKLNGLLLNLELKNAIKPLSGKFFEII
ncbi:MAG: DNA-processing protein DprA [Weeksellaceae bacterium]